MIKKKDHADICIFEKDMADLLFSKWSPTFKIQDGRHWRPSWNQKITHNFVINSDFDLVFFLNCIYILRSILWNDDWCNWLDIFFSILKNVFLLYGSMKYFQFLCFGAVFFLNIIFDLFTKIVWEQNF